MHNDFMIRLLPASRVCEEIIVSFHTFLKDNGFVDESGECLIGKRDYDKLTKETTKLILDQYKNTIIINDITWFTKTDERITGKNFFDIIINILKKCDFFIFKKFDPSTYPSYIFSVEDADVDGELLEELITVYYKSSMST